MGIRSSEFGKAKQTQKLHHRDTENTEYHREKQKNWDKRKAIRECFLLDTWRLILDTFLSTFDF